MPFYPAGKQNGDALRLRTGGDGKKVNALQPNVDGFYARFYRSSTL
ncbi:hypothetical protein OKW46_004376 [Paraburkholderia sp. WSM4179]|nr:hypothetical protein [Paraburkholderia sp. WSM4179]